MPPKTKTESVKPVTPIKRSIDDLFKEINKKFGEGSAVKGKDIAEQQIYVGYDTGSIALNQALGGKGFAKGRIIEILGEEAAGKSLISAYVYKDALSKGESVVYIEPERALSFSWLKTLGIDTDEMPISRPESLEDVWEVIKLLVDNGVDLIILDSITAAACKSEINGEAGDSSMGIRARINASQLRVVNQKLNKTGATLLIVSQTRQQIGKLHGDPTTTGDGKALPFYASQRVRLFQTRTGTKDKTGDRTSNLVTAKVIKNKIAAPFKSCELEVVYGLGISQGKELLKHAVTLGFVELSGSWYESKDKKLTFPRTQGAPGVLLWFDEHKEEKDYLYNLVLTNDVTVQEESDEEFEDNEDYGTEDLSQVS